MRWVTFHTIDRPRADRVDRVGLLDGDAVLALPPGTRLIDLLAGGGDALESAAATCRAQPDGVHPLDAVLLRAPVPRPPNFRGFAAFAEPGEDRPEAPPFYFGNASSVIGPGVDVEAPHNSGRLDFELDLAVVIGRPGRDIHPDEARAHIAGYTVVNDWCARDVEGRERAAAFGAPSKSRDFATSTGPWLVTPDEVGDDLPMRAWVNGRPIGPARTSGMVWSFPELISYASRCADLLPGDVLAAGPGLSLARNQPGEQWLNDGDEVAVEIESVGRMRNRIVRNRLPHSVG